MRKVLIDSNNNVVNVILIEEGANWSPPEGHTLIDDGPNAEPGGTWDGTRFTLTLQPPRVRTRLDDLRDILTNEPGGGDPMTLEEMREFLRLQQ